MSVKIQCEKCGGTGEGELAKSGLYLCCPVCGDKGYIVKGCENCKHEKVCPAWIDCDRIDDATRYVEITFCTAWEKKMNNKRIMRVCDIHKISYDIMKIRCCAECEKEEAEAALREKWAKVSQDAARKQKGKTR